MISFISTITPRYGDTDQMGVIHHANYLLYFEIGRLDWLNAMGFSYARMESDNILLPVYHIDIKYLKPMIFGNDYQLKTTLKKKPTNRVVFDYLITDNSGSKISQAELTLVFTDRKNFRPARPPKDFVEKCNQEWSEGTEKVLGKN